MSTSVGTLRLGSFSLSGGSQIDVFLVDTVVMKVVENLPASTNPLWGLVWRVCVRARA